MMEMMEMLEGKGFRYRNPLPAKMSSVAKGFQSLGSSLSPQSPLISSSPFLTHLVSLDYALAPSCCCCTRRGTDCMLRLQQGCDGAWA